MRIGDTFFEMLKFGAMPKSCVSVRWDGDIVFKRKDNLSNELGVVYKNNAHSVGAVFSRELGVPIRYTFKKPDGVSVFMIDANGLHEMRSGMWVNITNSFDKSEIFDYWMKGKTFQLIEPMPGCIMGKFRIGARIKGLPNHYGITNQDMTEAVITNIRDEVRGYVDIEVIHHYDSCYIGRSYDVNLFDPDDTTKMYFEPI